MDTIYLDHAATTPLRPEALEAMLPLLGERFGNPSSVHAWGRKASVALEEARERLAATIGAEPGEVIFTRGGTEADNLALLGRARAQPEGAVVCSATEHSAVLETVRALGGAGRRTIILPVDRDGLVELGSLHGVLTEHPAVVSVMWVNNEVGTVQPVPELAAGCREAGVVFHSDAIQALGKVELDARGSGADLLSFSAHKVGGPKGTGALFVRRGTALDPILRGGAQERGLRAGTQDVAGAVGFSLAAELAERGREREATRLGRLRDRLESGLRESVSELVVNGAGARRSPAILNVSIPGADGEGLVLALDLEGVAVSSGSACSSGTVEPSRVLTAMGLARAAAVSPVRFSLGPESNGEEIDRVLEILPRVIQRAKALAVIHA
ncbi:MAG: cysteine desulfurase family protein [Longimicrobiaceae bacterium]